MINEEKTISAAETELKNCTFVETVLMLLVILYHSMVFWCGNWFTANPIYQSTVLCFISKWLNSFHIFAFTLVSGYIFYYIKYEKGGYDKFAPFIKNKAKRLLVSYIFAAIVWVVPLQTAFLKYDFITILQKYILGYSPSQLWFLLMLFCVFIISWFMADFFKKSNVLSGLVVLCFYGLGFLLALFIPNIFSIWTAFKYLVFFWLGFKIRQNGSNIFTKIPLLVWIIVDIIIFSLYFYISQKDALIFEVVSIGVGFIANIIGAITAFLGLQKLASKIKWEDNKIFRIFSKNSMPMYLFHQQIIYVTIYFLNGLINPYINALINFIVATLISLVVSFILTKFKITRFLIGEK